MTITREEIHDAIDKKLDEWHFGTGYNIDRGRISIEIQIEKGKKTITVGERKISEG